MHLEAVKVYTTWGKSDLPHVKKLTSNSQVLHVLYKQFIGSDDSHIVLNMNSFGATTILSSTAKLGWPP